VAPRFGLPRKLEKLLQFDELAPDFDNHSRILANRNEFPPKTRQ
jgi:hypothetical protein